MENIEKKLFSIIEESVSNITDESMVRRKQIQTSGVSDPTPIASSSNVDKKLNSEGFDEWKYNPLKDIPATPEYIRKTMERIRTSNARTRSPNFDEFSTQRDGVTHPSGDEYCPETVLHSPNDCNNLRIGDQRHILHMPAACAVEF
jgi:hypothetical protein